MPYLSNAVILCEVDSQSNELRGGGQVLNTHQQVQHDSDSVCVDEHGLVAVLLGDVVQQTQRHLLEGHLPHQLHCLQQHLSWCYDGTQRISRMLHTAETTNTYSWHDHGCLLKGRAPLDTTVL